MLTSDDSVYRLENTWLLQHLYDIILMSTTDRTALTIEHELKRHLDVKGLGSLQSFLGILFAANQNGAWLSQCGTTVQTLKQ